MRGSQKCLGVWGSFLEILSLAIVLGFGIARGHQCLEVWKGAFRSSHKWTLSVFSHKWILSVFIQSFPVRIEEYASLTLWVGVNSYSQLTGRIDRSQLQSPKACTCGWGMLTACSCFWHRQKAPFIPHLPQKSSHSTWSDSHCMPIKKKPVWP